MPNRDVVLDRRRGSLIFPVEGESCLVAMVIGTQGLAPDEAIFGRPGQSSDEDLVRAAFALRQPVLPQRRADFPSTWTAPTWRLAHGPADECQLIAKQ